MLNTIKFIAACALCISAGAVFSSENACTLQSGKNLLPVLELYTSEGCSSCPPADQWLSQLKGQPAVVQAFHVGYWDQLGWVDRFATPAHTARQRQIAAWNQQGSIYTPQAVLNGKDWRNWGGKLYGKPAEPGLAKINLRQLAPDQFEALVAPLAGAPSRWSAYWTVTEHGHSSKVQAGENAGEFLTHDFVVRQYVVAGVYPSDSTAAQKLVFRSIAGTPGHARQLNLVVFDPQTGKTLQAITAPC
ncbi:hypothetical protein J2X19_001728 [Rhodoferax ferrireducens]|uniref:DUF1223 domain-containing protein n=1 Tax=Rhodoferax ferrireducens TaxID=192843 RepID=A0ABU2C6X1_9BURK|nr:DUF1223 domain-containing protein [Rhodoferax ferrireducens]MDR7377070.1 hypothetical protein [Rhodoferax ferrireducens]